MLKTNTQIKKLIFTATFAVFMIPALAFAGDTGSYGSDGWNSGSGWTTSGGYTDYTPYTGYSYTPTYSSYSPSYSSGSSYYPSYGSSYGSSYTPSYSSSYVPSYGTSYGSSYIPSSTNTNTSVKNNTKLNNTNNIKNTNTNTTTSSATATASSTNINNNINNNNVYVYTNPGGSAVVYNPTHVNLTGYCNIVPSNPRIGQTVTATAYAQGGVGDYTYTWGGDINQTSGVSTSFTSYTRGTKTITVTIRSGVEAVTKTCDVVFEDQTNNNNLSASCYANPTIASLNQLVTWRVNVNGGNGYYTYNWSGTDGLYGNDNYTTKQYSSLGLKNAYVTVYSNGQSVTTNCSMNVNGYNGSYVSSNISSGSPVSGIFTQRISSGTPVSGVYLNDLPATGISLNYIHYMVATMILILAAVFTFVYQARKKLISENI